MMAVSHRAAHDVLGVQVVDIRLAAADKGPALLLRIVVVVRLYTARLGRRDAVAPGSVFAGFGHDQALGVLEVAVDALDRCFDTVFLEKRQYMEHMIERGRQGRCQ